MSFTPHCRNATDNERGMNCTGIELLHHVIFRVSMRLREQILVDGTSAEKDLLYRRIVVI